MKSKSFLILLGMILFSSIFAQEQAVKMLEEFASQYGRITYPKYQNLKGSPYLEEHFQSGEIELLNGEKVKLNLRLNVFNDELEFEMMEGIQVLHTPDSISHVFIGSDDYIYLNPSGPDHEPCGYFKVLTGEDYLLLIKHQKEYIPPTVAGAYEPATDAEFRNNADVFYLVVNGQKPVKLKKKKKFIVNLIPSKEEEILRYIKSEKISLHNTNDLIELIDFLNTSI